jgi:L-iditol 2-dehydrogenase
VTIEATGVPAAVTEGMAMTRDAGTLVVAGQYTDAGEATFNPHHLVNRKHLAVLGTWGTDFRHLYLAVTMLSRFGHRFPLEQEISGFYGLADAGRALQDVEAGKVIKAVIDPRRAP